MFHGICFVGCWSTITSADNLGGFIIGLGKLNVMYGNMFCDAYEASAVGCLRISTTSSCLL